MKTRKSDLTTLTSFVDRRNEFSKSKLAMSLDYIFGERTSKALDYASLAFQYSRRTGRVKYVLRKDKSDVLFSFRPNGSIAPSLSGFSILLSNLTLSKISRRPKWCVTVLDEISPVIAQGKTVFCKHVVSCSNQLRAGEDVAVLNQKGELLAAGRTIVSGPTIKQFKRGVAVKVREGIHNAPDEF